MTDQYVYIRHKDFAWIPGLLVEQTKTTATVTHLEFRSETEIGNEDDDNDNNSRSRSTSRVRRTTTVTVPLKDYPNGTLPLQNVVDEISTHPIHALYTDIGYYHCRKSL